MLLGASSLPPYFNYWGKAKGSLKQSNLCWHPLVYHCLDVGAVGSALLKADPTLSKLLSETSSIPEKDLYAWVPFFLILHDLGKFADSFQGLQPDLMKMLQPQASNSKSYSTRHDTMGHLLCLSLFGKGLLLSDVQISVNGKLIEAKEDRRDILFPWVRSVTGHHGKPPESMGGNCFSKPAEADAAAFIKEVNQFLPLPQLHFQTSGGLENLLSSSAWLLAGLAILCDWIGSNERDFPYHIDLIPLSDYWSTSIKQAKKAIKKTGILSCNIRKDSPSALFPQLSLSPLQQKVQEISLTDGPQLFFLEDGTGSGKTEAALLLAKRLMQHGQERGIFFALPTTATANAMYARVENIYKQFFEIEKGKKPSLIVAHRLRDFVELGLEKLHPDDESCYDTKRGDLDKKAVAYCSEWLWDLRKKSLLAHVGVGTVDQALLGILPSRHNTLRLLGLARKVLIVDEVHSYDPYMNALLEALLEFHASFGGSAILLSATLPIVLRNKLLQAFDKGLHRRKNLNAAHFPADETIDGTQRTFIDGLSLDYPLLTQVSTSTFQQISLASRVGTERKVKVQFFHDTKSIISFLIKAVEDNQCVCWIRNSVADAISAYQQLKEQIPKEKISLFHARFTIGHRLEKESELLRRFGPKGGPHERLGRVVVSTQILEQSLDLDFDEMITDLAPIDLLIQRAGRLHRHPRDLFGKIKGGIDERPAPVLHVFSPLWQDDAKVDWVKAVLPKTALVYEDHSDLWLSMKILKAKEYICTPNEARELIEAVYGENAKDQLPQALLHNFYQADGKKKAEASVGQLGRLKFHSGYDRNDNKWTDDEKVRTRLTEDTIVAMLMVRDEQGKFQPLYHPSSQYSSKKPISEKHLWFLTQVFGVRTNLVQSRSSTKQDQEIEAWQQSLHGQGAFSLALVMEGQDHAFRGQAKNKQNEIKNIIYDAEHGLREDE